MKRLSTFAIHCRWALVLVAVGLAAGGITRSAGAQAGAAPKEEGPSLAECQQLLALRDETVKHARALQAVGPRKPPAGELCQLFKDFAATESAMVKGLEQHGGTCSVPSGVIERAWLEHIKTAQLAKQVCAPPAQGPRPAIPIGDFWTPDELRRMLGP
jgi:hypothetical protein